MKLVRYGLRVCLLMGSALVSSLHAQDAVGVGDAAEMPPTAAELLARAAQFRTEADQGRDEQAAKETRLLEAEALFQAAFLGDETARVRREQLLSLLRADESIAAEKRAEIVAFAESLPVARQSTLTPDERLAGFQRVATQLITEFPTVDRGYETLLNVARSQSDQAAEVSAQILLAAPEASGWVKKAAWDLAWRCELVGAVLADLTVPSGEKVDGLEPTRGRPAIVYAWATTNPFSLWLGGEIAARAPARVVVIGINLDADVAVARSAAARENLPGTQFYGYDQTGESGVMRWALRMTETPLVYVTDERGVIVSVSARRDLPTQLAAMAAR